MTQWMLNLPDELAEQARNAGPLSDSAIQQLLEDAMRCQAGGASALGHDTTDDTQALNELRALLSGRLSQAQRGEVMDASITDVAAEVL
jgi:Antitoxin ParD